MPILNYLTNQSARFFLPKSRYVCFFDAEPNNDKPKVYLTFDDGPHPEMTPMVLDELADLGAYATFFVQGQHVEKSPELVRRALDEGHSVGTHSFSHKNANDVSSREWIQDVDRARKQVEDICGVECSLFRPPYGVLTPLCMIELVKMNMRIVQWSHDFKDWALESTTEFCEWFERNPASDGAIVLLHDKFEITARNLYKGCSYWLPKVNFLAIPMTGENHD